jgi:hypothetical protein
MKNLRPYEPLNMCTAKWRTIEPEDVLIASLVPSQGQLSRGPLPAGHSHCGDPVIHVVRFQEKSFISDGHHRVNEAKMRGENKIKARVLTV